MKQFSKTCLRSGISIALVAAFCVCATADKGVRVDDVTLTELNGRAVELVRLKGQAVLLYLLTTGCDLCLADLPKLEHLHAEYKDKGLRIVLVVLDPGGPRIADPFARSLASPFPVVIADDVMRTGQSSLGPIPSVPRIVLVGPDTRVCSDRSGIVPFDVLHDDVDRVLDSMHR